MLWVQVWAGVVERGASGQVVRGTYQDSDTFQFQDDVGTVGGK